MMELADIFVSMKTLSKRELVRNPSLASHLKPGQSLQLEDGKEPLVLSRRKRARRRRSKFMPSWTVFVKALPPRMLKPPCGACANDDLPGRLVFGLLALQARFLNAKARVWFVRHQAGDFLISDWARFETINTLRDLCLRPTRPGRKRSRP